MRNLVANAAENFNSCTLNLMFKLYKVCVLPHTGPGVVDVILNDLTFFLPQRLV